MYTYQGNRGRTLVEAQVNASFFLVWGLTLALKGACCDASLFALFKLRINHRTFISSSRNWRGIITITVTFISDWLFSIINNFILIAFTSLSCGAISLFGGSIIRLRISFFVTTICSGCSLIRLCIIINLNLWSVFNCGINGTANLSSYLSLTFCSLAICFSCFCL